MGLVGLKGSRIEEVSVARKPGAALEVSDYAILDLRSVRGWVVEAAG